MYTRAAVFRLNARLRPKTSSERAFRRNTVTSLGKADACRTLAVAGRFERARQDHLHGTRPRARLRLSDLPSNGLLDHAHERRDFRRECELDGLFPRHRSSFVEGSVGSRLAEPGTGRAEVALAPGR